MSRSRAMAGLLAASLLALTACPALAQKGFLLDAIGEVDYTRGRSVVQVGAWVSYHVTTTRDGRVTDEYDTTVMISGEEEWWGEECFWVETLASPGPKAVVSTATLMSSSIFTDSLPLKNVLYYQRKRVAEMDEYGRPAQQTITLGKAAIKARARGDSGPVIVVDTLGTDTLKTPRGEFVCLRVRTERGVGTTSQSADSSRYAESRLVLLTERNSRIPVTGKVREEIVSTESQRTWLTGRSKESGSLKTISEVRTVLELTDFGIGGREAIVTPEPSRRSLAEQRRATPTPKPKAPEVLFPKR